MRFIKRLKHKIQKFKAQTNKTLSKLKSQPKADYQPLPPNMTITEWVKKMDKEVPYGRGARGKAFIVPQKYGITGFFTALRPDLPYRGDWSLYRRLGIGWKWNPTLYIAFFFFLSPVIGFPLIYTIYGYPQLFWEVFWRNFLLNIPFIIFVAFITKVIAFATLKIDDFVKPYGQYKKEIQSLFVNELEYYRFCAKTIERAYSGWWFIFGFLGFLAVLGFDIFFLLDGNLYRQSFLAPLPYWTIILDFIRIFGIALLLFLIITFFCAIIYGIFFFGSLGANSDVLSIKDYDIMLSNIINSISIALQNNTQISETENSITKSGRSYYEFQRINTMIGEFLFKITIYLIVFFIFVTIAIWMISALGLLKDSLIQWYFLFGVLSFFFMVISILIFIVPQYSLHKFLKKFKRKIIESFSVLIAQLESLYLNSIVSPSILSNIGDWKSRKELSKDIKRIENYVEKVKSYSSWSYDFPRKIKRVIIVGLSPIFPLISILRGLFPWIP
ncbi:MAG: hypothetical protein ACFFB8_10710 [Promethearchaeota archaeon]